MKGEDIMLVITAIAKLVCTFVVCYIGVNELDKHVVVNDDKSE